MVGGRWSAVSEWTQGEDQLAWRHCELLDLVRWDGIWKQAEERFWPEWRGWGARGPDASSCHERIAGASRIHDARGTRARAASARCQVLSPSDWWTRNSSVPSEAPKAPTQVVRPSNHHSLRQPTNVSPPQPFPLNPTFSPLPPLADSLKSKIYNAYVHNLVETPSATDSLVVRAVSLKFGVGMERVRAIIRLKELEKSWKDEVRFVPSFWRGGRTDEAWG